VEPPANDSAPALVTSIQNAFFESAALALTPREAERRFGADPMLAAAVLDLLVTAKVLRRRDDGASVRGLPSQPSVAA
jgi:hypothetical protein